MKANSEVLGAGSLYFRDGSGRRGLSGRAGAAACPRFALARRVGAILVLVLSLAALNLFGAGSPPVRVRVLASAVITVSLVPLWMWRSGSDRGLPFMGFYGIIFAALYAIPIFLVDHLWEMPIGSMLPDSLIARELKLSLVGLICLLVGYYGPQRLLTEPVVPKVNFELPGRSGLAPIAMILSVIGLMVFGLQGRVAVPVALQQIVLLGGDLFLLGTGCLLILQVIGELGWFSRLALWGLLVPARILLGFLTGLTSNGLFPVLFLVFLYASMRHRIPWKVVAMGALVFLVVRPAMVPYRILTWQRGRSAPAGRLEKMEILGRLVRVNLTGGESRYSQLIAMSSRRAAVSASNFASVLRDTPDHVPYWNGASYYPLLFKAVPRLLYPEKPREVTGQSFGHRYGLLMIGDYQTSQNLPQLVELYANFGTIGVVVGMFLFGMVFRAIQDALTHPQMGVGALVAASFISCKLLMMDSAASIVFGGLIWDFLFLWCLVVTAQFFALVRADGARARPGEARMV